MPSTSVSLPSRIALPALSLLLAALSLFAPTSSRAGAPAFAQVIYAARDRVYLDAGRRDGLAVGALLPVEREGREVARIEIVEVSDNGAAARIREQRLPPRLGDLVPFERPDPSPVVPVPTAPVLPKPRDEDLGDLWRASLEANPPPVVRYEADYGLGAPLSITGRAGTAYHLYSYIQHRGYTRHEQRFSFATSVENLGVDGLDVRFRGAVLARYDGRPDEYLPNRRAYPLIREVLVTYHPPKSPFAGSLGRFTPGTPIAHTIDGAEAGLETERLGLLVFGGLQPSEKDLMPTIHQQSFGAGVQLRPLRGAWRYELGGAALGEVREGRFCRTAVGVDNRLAKGDAFYLSQIATFDFIGTDNAGLPKYDFAVSVLGLDAKWRVGPKVTMDLRARYDEQTLFTEDIAMLDPSWIAFMRGDRHGRVEVGASWPTHKEHTLSPFLFTRGDLNALGVDRGYSGAGLRHRLPSLFGTRTGLQTTLDYGFGSGHLANVDLAFDTPFLAERLRLLSGLYNTWSRPKDSEVNTLRHLVYLLLSGHVIEGLDLFATLQGNYDHALVRLTYPFGVWLQLQAGATYVW